MTALDEMTRRFSSLQMWVKVSLPFSSPPRDLPNVILSRKFLRERVSFSTRWRQALFKRFPWFQRTQHLKNTRKWFPLELLLQWKTSQKCWWKKKRWWLESSSQEAFQHRRHAAKLTYWSLTTSQSKQKSSLASSVVFLIQFKEKNSPYQRSLTKLFFSHKTDKSVLEYWYKLYNK